MAVLGGGAVPHERGTPVILFVKAVQDHGLSSLKVLLSFALGEVRALIRECPPFVRFPKEVQSEIKSLY